MEQLYRSSGDTTRVERELSNLCVYERFRVDGLKRYVNDDRFRVDGDKNMRLLAFAFTIVFVWTGSNTIEASIFAPSCHHSRARNLIKSAAFNKCTALVSAKIIQCRQRKQHII